MKVTGVEPVKNSSLELEEDIALFKKGTIAQWIGRAIMYLLIVLTALGLFGTGPLSNKTLQGNNASVEYEFFQRYQHESKFRIKMTGVQKEARIAFPLEYINSFEGQIIQPQPESAQMLKNHVVFTFPANEDAEVIFSLQPETFGSLNGTVNVNNEQFQISHFVYP